MPSQNEIQMRQLLATSEDERRTYRAEFSRIGRKVGYQGYSEETILLKNIIDVETRLVVADHIWFSYTKGFQKVNLQEGVLVEFEARTKKYKKGYVNRKWKVNDQREDYKLSNPTKIKIVRV